MLVWESTVPPGRRARNNVGGVDGQATAEASEPPVERWARELFDETLLRLAAARLEHDRLLYNDGTLPDLARARIVLEDVRGEMDVARRWVRPYLDASSQRIA